MIKNCYDVHLFFKMIGSVGFGRFCTLLMIAMIIAQKVPISMFLKFLAPPPVLVFKIKAVDSAQCDLCGHVGVVVPFVIITELLHNCNYLTNFYSRSVNSLLSKSGVSATVNYVFHR